MVRWNSKEYNRNNRFIIRKKILYDKFINIKSEKCYKFILYICLSLNKLIRSNYICFII